MPQQRVDHLHHNLQQLSLEDRNQKLIEVSDFEPNSKINLAILWAKHNLPRNQIVDLST